MRREKEKNDIDIIHKMFEDTLHLGFVQDIERLGGLTNHTYKVSIADKKVYIIRIPGEGTEEIINRRDEKISTQLACQLGIDSKLIYFGDDGIKVCNYISNAKTMSSELMRQEKYINSMANILTKLHTCGYNTGVVFEFLDMAENYEKVICSKNVELFEDYLKVKKEVLDIRNIMKEHNGVWVPCHNDPLCENWVEGTDGLYLIDWEYAGMNDGMWDLADISIEAGYEEKHDNALLEAYLGKKPNATDKKRFLANKIYLDYLWSLWGKTRVPFDGKSMEIYAIKRFLRLKDNLNCFHKCC